MEYRGVDDEQPRTWYSGIYKSVVSGPVWAGTTNLAGDGQCESIHHGGPDRPILMLGSSSYERWGKELGRELDLGSFGENLTVDCLNEDNVCIGDVWETGRVTIEVSQPRIPCNKLGRRLENPEVANKIMDAREGGWYCRVLAEGEIQAGEELRLTRRVHPEWTVRRAFDAYVFRRDEPEITSELARIEELSSTWKDSLRRLTERAAT